MSEVSEVLAARGPEVGDRLDAVEARLREVAASAAPPLGALASDTIAAGGKRLRPLLVLLAAGAGGREPADEAAVVRAGVAVELIHSATLVHDDVLDAAPLRRGRPTVWSVAGAAGATAVGDFLFARAFTEIVRNGSA
ncbi:MAG TPA: polyprenyl synthetase family protein, partial [Capillimicrobium sp.]